LLDNHNQITRGNIKANSSAKNNDSFFISISLFLKSIHSIPSSSHINPEIHLITKSVHKIFLVSNDIFFIVKG